MSQDSKPAFGSTFTSNMIAASYSDGAWSPFTIRPLQNYSLHPGALVLHYSQTIFEGMKAYRKTDGSVALFRPEVNAARLNKSARRMLIPQIDEAAFLAILKEFVALEREQVPERPGALYLRPAIFASEAALGVRTATSFEFMTLALPVASYFGGSGLDAIDLWVTTSVIRAARGGTGDVKAGANYAITLQIIERAKEAGCGQVLFLDSSPEALIEEAGGMNVMFVRGKQLLTPALSGTFLNGVTRDSILKIAPSLGLEPWEGPMQFADVLAEIESGAITEAFLCGTAATIVSIRLLRLEDGRVVNVGAEGSKPVTTSLYERLLSIQFGSDSSMPEWTVSIP